MLSMAESPARGGQFLFGDSMGVSILFGQFGDARALVQGASAIRDDSTRWGGDGIMLTLEQNWASMAFGCARASVPGGLKPARNGKFNIRGTYFPGTAIQSSEKPKSLTIRVEGRLDGKHMALKITNIDNGTVIGNYILERGKAVKLSICQ